MKAQESEGGREKFLVLGGIWHLHNLRACNNTCSEREDFPTAEFADSSFADTLVLPSENFFPLFVKPTLARKLRFDVSDFGDSVEKTGAQTLTKDVYTQLIKKYKRLDVTKSKLESYCTGLAAKMRDIQIMGMAQPKNLDEIYVTLRVLDPDRPSYLENTSDYAPDSDFFISILEGEDDLEVPVQGSDFDKFAMLLESSDLDDLENISETLDTHGLENAAIRWMEEEGVDRTKGVSNNAPEYRGRDAIELVDGLKRVVVLAGPGSGKTTFLKYCALEYLSSRVSPIEQPSILPLFVSLRDIDTFSAPDGSPGWLLDFLCTMGSNVTDLDFSKEWLSSRLKSGDCIVLLDGIDEIPQEHYKRCLKSIQAFSDKFRKNRVIATCRRASYKTGLQGFSTVELAPFSDEDVINFSAKWFSGKPETFRRFCSDLARNKTALDMCSTPLLTTMICISYEFSRSLATNRAELYGNCVDALLFTWDTFRAIDRKIVDPAFTAWKKKVLLSQIARELFDSNSYQFSKSRLLKLIGAEVDRQGFLESVSAEALLREIEENSGLIVERDPDQFTFSHLSFQEFFTAVNYHEKGQHAEVFQNYRKDDRYREILLLCLEKSFQPAQQVRELIDFFRNQIEYGESFDISMLIEVREMKLPMHPKLRAVLNETINDVVVHMNAPPRTLSEDEGDYERYTNSNSYRIEYD